MPQYGPNVSNLLGSIGKLGHGPTTIPIGNSGDPRQDYGQGPGVIPTNNTMAALTNAVGLFLTKKRDEDQAQSNLEAVSPILKSYGLSDEQIGSIKDSMDAGDWNSLVPNIILQHGINQKQHQQQQTDANWNPQEQSLLQNFYGSVQRAHAYPSDPPSQENVQNSLSALLQGVRPEKLNSVKSIIDIGNQAQLFPYELKSKASGADLAGTQAEVAGETAPYAAPQKLATLQATTLANEGLAAKLPYVGPLAKSTAGIAANKDITSGVEATNAPQVATDFHNLRQAQTGALNTKAQQGPPGTQVNLKNSKQINDYLKGYRGQLENLAQTYPNPQTAYLHLKDAIPGLQPPPRPPTAPQATGDNDLMGDFGTAPGAGKKAIADYLKNQVHPAVNNYVYDLSRQRYPSAAAIADQLRQMHYDTLDEYNHPEPDTHGGNLHIHKLPTETYKQFKQNILQHFGRYLYVSPLGENGQHSSGGMMHGVDGADFLIRGLDSEDVGQGQ